MNSSDPSARWTPEKARAWYANQPWLVGANYVPATAINQLEMFQPDDYDRHRATLVRELDWAAALGLNTLRVFLHDLLWFTDADGFCRRFDDFLDLCAARSIRPMIVFFDACHQPEPLPGIQPAPRPGVHNSGWAQSPAVSTLMDEREWGRLERYVTGVLTRHAHDERILCWDLYNEPCNPGYDQNEHKFPACAKLAAAAFAWARAVAPTHPLTVCVWADPDPLQVHDESLLDASALARLRSQQIAIEQSDFITFHHYGPADSLHRRIVELSALGRPVMCTEYMARHEGSRFQTCLPVLKEHGVAAYNWGFVSGKTQTIFPWKPPEDPHAEPAPWFHDILRADGTPYDAEETSLLRSLSGVGAPLIRKPAQPVTAPATT